MAKTKTSFKRGEAKGKPKGALNHTTKDIKEAFKMLIEKNIDNLSGWLDHIAEKNPERALKIIIDLSEYIIPKLARTEAEITDKTGTLRKTVYDLFPPELMKKLDEKK